jgi:hypothetical protein
MLGLGVGFYKLSGEDTGALVDDTKPTYSLALDGAGDFVSFSETTYAIDDAGDNGSISFWAKRTDNSDEASVLGNSSGPSTKRLWFGADGDRLDIEGEQPSQQAYATVTAATNWRHYVVTWAGQDGGNIATTIMYEDGSALSTTQVNFGVSNDKDFVINQIGGGGNEGTNTHEFKGLLYQIAMWDVTLDADAVAAIYNSGTPISLRVDTGNYDNSGDLVTLWRFHEGGGSTTTDSIGNLTGTFAGDTTFSTDIPPNE